MIFLLILLQLPIASRTPGAINRAVTQANIHETICTPNWTRTVRPATYITDRLKAAQMKAWKLPGKASDYEEDHLISLELGGHPTDARNLWPEAYNPRPGAHEKDRVERYLRQQVCLGRLTLKQAQHLIATDWLAVYKSLVRK